METAHYHEMIENLKKSIESDQLKERIIYLFGHCEATLTLADELLKRGLTAKAILDNSSVKYGILYKDIPVQAPDTILGEDADNTVVLIVTRFYEAMNAQLRGIGFSGTIRKLVDFNTYAEYSLTDQTISGKRGRCGAGEKFLIDLESKYPGGYFIFCPFPALGDIYFCMSYLPYFSEKRNIKDIVICVSSKACADVVRLFGEKAEVMSQKELDSAIQAVFTTQYKNAFVAHQDRPYLVNLHRALRVKKIPLEDIYRTGIFGLSESAKPVRPINWEDYAELDGIPEGQAAILSPYAKSVTALPEKIWTEIVSDLKAKGYLVFTNTVGDEKPLKGTDAISPSIPEIKSVAERAGLFIGIRSGLCDVLRTAKCRKVALFPDYNYCDTKWKSIDMYSIDGFENIVVKDGDTWEELKGKIKL